MILITTVDRLSFSLVILKLLMTAIPQIHAVLSAFYHNQESIKNNDNNNYLLFIIYYH